MASITMDCSGNCSRICGRITGKLSKCFTLLRELSLLFLNSNLLDVDALGIIFVVEILRVRRGLRARRRTRRRRKTYKTITILLQTIYINERDKEMSLIYITNFLFILRTAQVRAIKV